MSPPSNHGYSMLRSAFFEKGSDTLTLTWKSSLLLQYWVCQHIFRIEGLRELIVSFKAPELIENLNCNNLRCGKIPSLWYANYVQVSVLHLWLTLRWLFQSSAVYFWCIIGGVLMQFSNTRRLLYKGHREMRHQSAPIFFGKNTSFGPFGGPNF